jgi:hypothetical protein
LIELTIKIVDKKVEMDYKNILVKLFLMKKNKKLGLESLQILKYLFYFSINILKNNSALRN